MGELLLVCFYNLLPTSIIGVAGAALQSCTSHMIAAGPLVPGNRSESILRCADHQVARGEQKA